MIRFVDESVRWREWVVVMGRVSRTDRLRLFGLVVLGGVIVAVFIVADRVATTRRESEVIEEKLPA